MSSARTVASSASSSAASAAAYDADASALMAEVAKGALDKTKKLKFSNYSHCKYIGSRALNEMCWSVAYVIGTTGVCAGIGALAGSPAGGIGAGPGAAIGAVVGLVVSATTVTVCRFIDGFRGWKEAQKNEIVSDMFDKFKKYAKLQGENLECPLTLGIPKHPVKTPHSNHVFERADLEAWVDKHGTCPTTRKPLKKEQLRTSVCTMAHVSRICREIISKQIVQLDLTPEQIDGMKKFKADFDKNLKSYFSAELAHLSSEVDSGAMDYQQFATQVQGFANAAQPRILDNSDEKG